MEMVQQIKIGVSADAAGAAKGVENLDRAVDNLAGGLDGVARAADVVDAKLTKIAGTAKAVADATQRIRNIQWTLQREFKSPVSEADAGRFSDNFDRIRAGGGLGSQRVREFGDFHSWFHGHPQTFKRKQDAEAHRMRILARGMQGTNWAMMGGMQNDAPPVPPSPPGAPSRWGDGVPRAASSAWGMTKSMLGVAGIATSVAGMFGMVGQGVQYATAETEGLDALKRRFGTRGMSYGALQQGVRGAGAGLGVSYVDSANYGMEYASAAGRPDDDIGSKLRLAYGVSRGLGVDPGQGVNFMGTMSRVGVASDDAGQRKLALLIADAIEQGGFTAKADEVLREVADYSAVAARASLSTPNVGSYMSALTSLTSTGSPGLDPAGAGNILGKANAAMMQGGAMGDASKNLSYAATANGVGPVVAQALWAGGIFGSPDSVFGLRKNRTQMGRWFDENHVKTLSGPRDNLSLTMEMLRRQYSGMDQQYLLSGVMGQFGLSSPQEAMGLDWVDKHRAEFGAGGATGKLLSSVGVDINKITNFSGIPDIAKVAGAGGIEDLRSIYGDTVGRKDITDKERASLKGLFESGDLSGTKGELAKILAANGQAGTAGTDTRTALVDLKDTLTDVGAKLLEPMDAIKEAVVGMYSLIAPQEYRDRMQADKDSKTDFSEVVGNSGLSGALKSAMSGDDAAYDAAAKSGGPVDINKITPQPTRGWADNPVMRFLGLGEDEEESSMPYGFAGQSARRQHIVSRYMKGAGGDLTKKAMDYLQSKGVDQPHAAAMVGNWLKESSLNAKAVGDGGNAHGLEQWHDDRTETISRHFRKSITDMSLEEQMDASLWELRDGPEAANGRGFFNASGSAGDLARLFNSTIERPRNPVADGYRAASFADLAMKGMPLPPGDPNGTAERAAANVRVSGSAEITIRDQKGNVLGRATPLMTQMPTTPTHAGASGDW